MTLSASRYPGALQKPSHGSFREQCKQTATRETSSNTFLCLPSNVAGSCYLWELKIKGCHVCFEVWVWAFFHSHWHTVRCRKPNEEDQKETLTRCLTHWSGTVGISHQFLFILKPFPVSAHSTPSYLLDPTPWIFLKTFLDAWDLAKSYSSSPNTFSVMDFGSLAQKLVRKFKNP